MSEEYAKTISKFLYWTQSENFGFQICHDNGGPQPPKKSSEIFRASQSSRMRWMSRMNRDYRENDQKLPKKCQRTLSDSRSSAGLRAKELLCFCTWWDLKLGWRPPNGPRDWETLQESWDLGKIWVLFRLSQHLGCRNLFRTAVNYPDYPKSIHHANPSNSTSHDLLKDVKKHEERKLRELMYFSQPNTILPSVCPSWKVSLIWCAKTRPLWCSFRT